MAFPGLVHAGEDRVHDAELGLAPDASARNAVPGADAAVTGSRRLERANDGRSNGDDPPAARLRAIDRRRGSLRDAKRLVERETRVERRTSGRGNAGGVRERGEADAAPPPDLERSPVAMTWRRSRIASRGSSPPVTVTISPGSC